MPNVSPLGLIGMSCIRDMKWMAGFGLSGPATVLIGMAIDTVRPERTSEAAARDALAA